jgi:hypothetical protein
MLGAQCALMFENILQKHIIMLTHESVHSAHCTICRHSYKVRHSPTFATMQKALKDIYILLEYLIHLYSYLLYE